MSRRRNKIENRWGINSYRGTETEERGTRLGVVLIGTYTCIYIKTSSGGARTSFEGQLQIPVYDIQNKIHYYDFVVF